jgi:hypothetical protein
VVHTGRFEVHPTIGPASSGNVTEVLWYVPAVKSFVKREYRDTMSDLRTREQFREELTEYKVQ